MKKDYKSKPKGNPMFEEVVTNNFPQINPAWKEATHDLIMHPVGSSGRFIIEGIADYSIRYISPVNFSKPGETWEGPLGLCPSQHFEGDFKWKTIFEAWSVQP